MPDLIEELESLRRQVVADFQRHNHLAKRLDVEHSQRNADFIAYVQSIEHAIEKRHAHARQALAHLAEVIGVTENPEARAVPPPPPPLPHQQPMEWPAVIRQQAGQRR